LVPSLLKAEQQFSVPREGFECLLRHASRYIEQGEEIFVKFDTCPQRPSPREELAMAGARNVFPTNPSFGRAEDGVPIFTNTIILTPLMLDCLRINRSRILEQATVDRVFIFPNSCQR